MNSKLDLSVVGESTTEVAIHWVYVKHVFSRLIPVTLQVIREPNSQEIKRPHGRSENILKKCAYELYTIIN